MTNKLPIFVTAQAVYRLLYDDAGYAFKIVGSLIFLTLALPLTISIATGGNTVLMAIAIFGFPTGWLVIAVFWHRRYLCREAPSLSLVQHFFVSIAYSLDFLITAFLASQAIVPAILIFFFVAGFMSEAASDVGNGGLFNLALVFSALISVMVFFRISLALAATSLGNAEFGIDASWRYTRGNGVRLLCVWILAAFPTLVLTVLCFKLGGSGIYVYSWIELLLRMSCASFFLSITLLNAFSVMSIVYAFLVEKEALRDAVDLEMSNSAIRH